MPSSRISFALVISIFTLVLLNSCAKPSVESHFSAAQAALRNEEDLPLAMWHLQEYIALANNDAPNLPLARIQLDKCKADILHQLESGSHTGTRIQDLGLKVRLLDQQNTELTNWKERLLIENKALRNALIQAQKNSPVKSRQ